jgi:hypothetical protein
MRPWGCELVGGVEWGGEGEVGERAYPIRNRPAHTRNHDYTSAISKFDHLFRTRLGRHEDTRDIDLEHAIRIFRSVVQRRGLLLDTRCSDEAIEASFRVRDVLDDLVECGDVADVDLTVVEGGVEVFLGALGDLVEVGGGLGESVECVDWERLVLRAPVV